MYDKVFTHHSDRELNGQALITFSRDYGVFLHFVLWVIILLYAESKIYWQIFTTIYKSFSGVGSLAECRFEFTEILKKV